MAKAHQPLVAVEDALDHALRITRVLHRLDHRQHPGRGAAMQRPRHRADRTGQRRGDVRAGGRDHPGSEGGGVHAVLGGGDPIGVDGLDVARVWVALPPGHELGGDGGALVDRRLRYRGPEGSARGLRDEGQRHRRRAGQLLTRGLVVDIQQRLKSPDRRQHGQAGLHVDAHVAGVHRQLEPLGRLQARAKLAVHQ